MPINRESQNEEFKSNWHDDYLKTICAFANTDGGKVFLGVDDNGEIVELNDIDRLLVELPNKINSVLSILPSITIREEGTLKYLEIKVDSYSVPISCRGKYYIRSGSTTQQLNGTALTDFLQRKTGRTWDENAAIAYNDVLIKEETLLKFRNNAQDKIPSIAHENDLKQILEKLHLIENNKIKYACILLFGNDPQANFINAKIRIGKFTDDANVVSQDEVGGNLFDQVIHTIEIIRTKYLQTNVKFESGDIERKDVPEYPLEALREAILNAITHRDYSVSTTIFIKFFKDKLVISNSGSLPPEVPLSKLKSAHISKPRNPLIAEIFQKAGYIETWGRGTNKIVQSCKEAGLPEPDFNEENNIFTVTFYKDNLNEENLKKLGLSERQIHAVLYIKKEGNITNKKYREINNISDETARNELKDLVEREILVIKGKGPSVKYLIKQ
ncbi:MAG: transcriptional regulator [Ignavibacteriae bacterium]|nr:MAG: transcriptional regulator [Ignavibacteriota bacterium]